MSEFSTSVPTTTDEMPTREWQWRWPDVAAITAVLVAILLIGLPIVTLLWGPEIPMNPDNAATFDELEEIDISLAYSLAVTALQAVAFGFGVWVVMAVRRIPSTAVKLRGMSTNWWLISVGLGLLCIPLTSYIAYGFQLLFYDEVSNPQLEAIVPDGFSWTALIAMTLLVGLAIPFVEELFFRGVLLTWLRQKLPFWAAALVSSSLFALLHGEPSLIVGTLVLGLLAAWAVENSGSLWSGVVIHVLNNATKVLLLYAALIG